MSMCGCHHLISIDDLSKDDIARIFYESRSAIANISERAVVMTAFFEPSTRTRLSFAMACAQLGISVIHFEATSSSMSKGETVDETIRNLIAMAPDILIIRSSESLTHKFGDHLAATSIINAGDGSNEHPTQALLDAFTLLNHFTCDDLVGKRILIIGDIEHSRVAHSSIKLFNRLGAEVSLLAPQNFLQQKNLGQQNNFTKFLDVQGEFHAVMCLRIQKERIRHEAMSSDGQFFRDFGLTSDRFAMLGRNTVLLHPGPHNAGVEIAQELVEHPRSLIRQQVRNGVVIRAALIQFLLRGKHERKTRPPNAG